MLSPRDPLTSRRDAGQDNSARMEVKSEQSQTIAAESQLSSEAAVEPKQQRADAMPSALSSSSVDDSTSRERPIVPKLALSADITNSASDQPLPLSQAQPSLQPTAVPVTAVQARTDLLSNMLSTESSDWAAVNPLSPVSAPSKPDSASRRKEAKPHERMAVGALRSLLLKRQPAEASSSPSSSSPASSSAAFTTIDRGQNNRRTPVRDAKPANSAAISASEPESTTLSPSASTPALNPVVAPIVRGHQRSTAATDEYRVEGPIARRSPASQRSTKHALAGQSPSLTNSSVSSNADAASSTTSAALRSSASAPRLMSAANAQPQSLASSTATVQLPAIVPSTTASQASTLQRPNATNSNGNASLVMNRLRAQRKKEQDL